MRKTNKTSAFYLVATPIGNREDMNFRAIAVLKSVDYILAEDTRHSKPLLKEYEIDTPVHSFHQHNEHQIQDKIVSDLQNGLSIALISDAGMPLVSDPGYSLVQKLHAENLPLFVIPGPVALINALVGSGLPTDRFCFEGFLPAKTKARLDRLQQLATEKRTLIFYESPHRLVDCLQDFQQVFGDERMICLAKELTKIHEQYQLKTIPDLIQWLKEDALRLKGEFVLVLEGAEVSQNNVHDLDRFLSVLLKDNISVKQSAKIVSQLLDLPKNQVYERAMEILRNL